MTETPKFTGIRALAAKGLLVTGIAQVWRVTIGVISSIVLVRLLTPADFGLFAAVTACLAFITLIQDLGLNQATIQRSTISPGQMSGLFWISVALGVALAIIMFFSAPALAWFFGDARIEGLAMACSSLLVLGALQSQHIALLNRDLRYRALAAIDVMSATLSAVVGMAIAWFTASYWALFAASLMAVLVSALGAWTLSRWKPGRPNFEGQFSEIFQFGAGASGFNVVNYFARNADNLLIGRYYGPTELGLYDRAYRLLLFPLSQFMLPIGRIVFPLLSRLQLEPRRYRQAYFESVSLLVIATQPGLVFAIVFSNDVFLLLFGPQWVDAARIFSCLGVAGLIQVMNSPTGWLFLSQGRGGDFFWVGLCSSIGNVVAFVAGLPWGALGVAVAYALSEFLVRVPITWIVVGRKGPIGTLDLIRTSFPQLIATLATGIAMWTSSFLIEPPHLVGCIGLALASYLLYLIVLASFPSKRQMLLGYLKMLRLK